MYKRYDLDVYYADVPIYAGSFSSINLLVKFACGFDRSICELSASDSIFDRSIPVEELCLEFEGDRSGI